MDLSGQALGTHWIGGYDTKISEVHGSSIFRSRSSELWRLVLLR